MTHLCKVFQEGRGVYQRRLKTSIGKEPQKQAIAELLVIKICFTFIIKCIFFGLQVDRPITKKGGSGGLISRSLQYLY